MINLRSDPRYTITLEHCGHDTPMHVVRFCGDWIECHKSKGKDLLRAASLSAERRGSLLTIEAKETP